MNYTIDQLNDWMDWLQTQEKAIRIDRGKRYGNKEDTLANVRRGGWMGCILSANECMERLWTMYDNKMSHGIDPDPDDLLNAVNDLRNFAGYIANLFGIAVQPTKELTVCACDMNQTYDPPVDMPCVKEWTDDSPITNTK